MNIMSLLSSRSSLSLPRALIAIPLAGAILIGAPAQAQVTTNFSGRILGGSCTVDTSSRNQNIPLGDFTADSFATVGSGADWADFDIRLTSCPSTLTAIDFKLDGTADTSDRRYLALTSGSGVAAGIAIQISRAGSSTPLSPGGIVDSWTGLANYNRAFGYSARYIRVGAVKAGTANASAVFTISYR